jgi:hypothetical protein
MPVFLLAVCGRIHAQDSVLLTSGVIYTGPSSLRLVGSDSQPLYFQIVVPPGQNRLLVETGGGEGGIDIYVRRGAFPTSNFYDGFSFGFTTTNSVTINNPISGTYYIALAGSGFFGAAVRATYLGAVSPPTWTWAKATAGGAGGNSRQSLGCAADSAGNVFTVGVFQGTAQFGPIQLIAGAVAFPGLSDREGGFLAKYDPTGTVLWAIKDVGQRANAVTVGPNGSVYVTGAYTGTVRFSASISLTTAQINEMHSRPIALGL